MNPFQSPFLSIFKHNGILTSPFTVFSQKVDMGSGFPGTETHSGFRVLRNGNSHDVSRSGFLGIRNPLGVPVPENPEPISNICEKTVKGDVNIPLRLKMDKNGL